MYCLQVEIAWPDWKRASVETIVEHYTTEEFAKKRLQAIKRKYIKDRQLVDEKEKYITVKELDNMI